MSKTGRLTLATFKVLTRRLPYIAFWFACLYGMFWLAPKAYYLAMPGSWWVDVTGPVTMTNAGVGRTSTLTFCRDLRRSPIDVQMTRSFYRVEGARLVPISDYTRAITLQGPDGCRYPTITADQLPKQAGSYQARTTYTFCIEGNCSKTIAFDLDQPFIVSDTSRSLELRIQELQEQIYQLQQQRGGPSGSRPTTPQNPAPAAATTTSQAVPPNLVVRQQTETTRSTTPPSSVPPTPPASTSVEQPVAVVPPTPEQPVDPPILQGTLVSVLQTATGIVDGLVRPIL